ncbi:MAG: dihydrolipoamide acetyltransferase family protein, partial [Bacteroidota bacterium]
MAKYEVIVPKLGESVIEATITKWLKNEGETVQEDEPLVEIATDKVDSEITSPVSGVLKQKVSEAGSVVPVGKVFAILETGTELIAESQPVMLKVNPFQQEVIIQPDFVQKPVSGEPVVQPSSATGTRFYSPLVRSIAQQEGLSFSELDNIPGTGKDDRITKHDLLNFLKDKQSGKKQDNIKADSPEHIPVVIQQVIPGEDSIVEMNRIRLLIATHMVKSVQTAPHVTSFMEVDMTRIVQWRDQNKDGFQKRENEKLTFTPIFMEAIAKGVRDFPMINVSVDGTKIIVHSNVNIGMAVALPNFNLIVPVVRNAHEKNLLGIVKTVNDLAERA